jgi:hypothetical protein
MSAESGFAAPGRMPDFFIVGHAKCGTTALYVMLRHHPRLFMPFLKEPQFFAPEMRADPWRSRGLPRTIEDYVALFAPATPEQLAGEASPSYLRSPTAAEQIAANAPAARIVAILREPSSFLRSLHLQFVQTMIEPEVDLGKALRLEASRSRGQNLPRHGYWQQALMYSQHVRYVEQLHRFHAVFPREQVLTVIYDDFRADNDATARQIMRFLGVDDSVAIKVVEANPTVRVRAERLHEVKRALQSAQGPAARAVKTSVSSLIPRAMRRAVLRPARRRVRRAILFGDPAAPDASLMLELRRRFAGEVTELSEYLDRDLVTLWGYDKLG